jgi:2-methylaconitate cis-trans-isomerase PrpF
MRYLRNMNVIDPQILSNSAPGVARKIAPLLRREGARLRRIPCVLMRGGTSRGPFFLEEDLPRDPVLRDKLLLRIMGSPHQLQIDGIGGANSLTSKVAIVSRGTVPGADVDYLFAQVSVEKASVDTGPNCGNMLSAVAPFAIESGLVEATAGETTVRIYNRNTKSLIEAVVQTPDGVIEYDGDAVIDGVPGAAAPIRLSFGDAAGSKTGALFPTGMRSELINGIEVTLVDYAMPMVLIDAQSLGVDGAEDAATLNANADLFSRMEPIRLEAGQRMGLGDVSGRVIPKIGVMSRPRNGGTVTSRYFVPDSCHRAHSATGALCVAAAVRSVGTVANKAAGAQQEGAMNQSLIVIEHPGGRIDIDMELGGDGAIRRAAFVRTARRIFEGNVIVPADLCGQA